MSYLDVRSIESDFMEQIYSGLDNKLQKAKDNKENAIRDWNSGNFDYQDAFTAAGEKSTASKKAFDMEKHIKTIQTRPYFAHIALHITDEEEEEEDIFLSANEELDTAERIDDKNIVIYPFKQDREKPLISAVFRCYQEKTGHAFQVEDRDKSLTAYQPTIIRDVEVENRELGRIICYYPESDSIEDKENIVADEYLSEKLNENREKAELRNIITTLQQKQFEIISTDIKSDFIVQGCPGSGKTQCLIHRLFFLRDSIDSDIGWEKVLLLTPSELFRNYSFPLMRKYRMESVNNISLPAFYKNLLENYDSRFANRQYVFELTEEYLPDFYLNQVYSQENIHTIKRKIDEAIREHVWNGCHFLHITEPADEQIDIYYVNELARKLDLLLKDFDEKEKTLLKSEEYQEYKHKAEELEKKLSSSIKKKEEYISRAKKLQKDIAFYEDLSESLSFTKNELEKIEKARNDQTKNVLLKLHEDADSVQNDATLQSRINAMVKFADTCREIDDIYILQSDVSQSEMEYRDLYHEKEQAVSNFTGGVKPEKWMNKRQREMDKNDHQIKEISQEICDMQNEFDEIQKQIQRYGIDIGSIDHKEYRSQLSKEKNYLSRIESSLFEQEVWNALAPQKTQYDIQTIEEHISAENGTKKQYRILYKSDLLFYLFIYIRLHPKKEFQDYLFICIDEGQDLHQADYALLRSLFPSAIYNVFGDTAQVLHTACGISEWKTETGIQKVFELADNYRNTPAIVDFCNRKFDCDMAYFGKIGDNMQPEIVHHNEDKMKIAIHEAGTVIVKDKIAFENLCSKVPTVAAQLEYVDTNSSVLQTAKIPCYSIFAAKGLEFPNVFVFSDHMTNNQKLVACTRAMKHLYYYESEE